MATKKIPFICKCSADDSLYALKPIKIQDERYLICEKATDPIPVTGEEKVIICFDMATDKYFMQSSITPSADGKWWRIDGNTDVFKLQRRQSFRISIPPTYKSKAIFRDSETDEKICNGILTDISSGGCKILVDGASQLASGQAPLIDIYIGRRDPITLTGEIRHVQKIIDPHPQECLGIMFKSVSSLMESKLFAITMELHRELVGKISK